MVQALALSSSDARVATLGDATLSDQSVPVRHLAVILDGNRRWAQRLRLQSIDGYRAGGRKVHALLSWCSEAGIPLVTLWPLSAENLSRDQEELRALLTVIVEVFEELAGSHRWRLRVIGDLSRLPRGAAHRIQNAERRTAGIDGITVNIGVAYNGRLELLYAIRTLIANHLAAGTLDTLLTGLGPELIASHLYTAGQPDPDLIIRTSGEQRLSDFMLWQSAYSEFHFTPVCWPDFSRADFDEALRIYRSRHRRFGQ
ncbi:polyprenyl diphosphate synthase [Paraburkholderia phymatum]|uniref:Polyprenyl diphosphate synthase n=1 Tax=Paraburkholderia phymatum TaxID=148447 RepID=A0ACC6UD77_9BURK